MNRKQYEIDNLPTQIVIGHQTETGVTSIYFDCTSWLASWPDLVLGVWATQPGGTAAYPAATHMEGDVLVWDVTDSDTAVPGVGTVEIVGITTGKKKLSAIAKTQIMRTTTGTATEPPEGAKAWVDSVMQAANDAETSKSQAATYAQNAAASAEKAEENAKSVTWETLSGKPSTFPPDSHTHTLESLGAASAESVSALKNDKLDKTGTAADSSKLGGKAPEYYLQPRNLLDNSDFTNLVAQAGIGGNHGTVTYAADRWILDSGTVSYEAGVGLTLSGTIRQKLKLPPTGNTSAFVGMTSGEASISYADGAVTITSGGGVIKWAALYEGSYTDENLPPFVAPEPVPELLKCQRYCFVVNPDWASVHSGKTTGDGTGMLITFRTPVAMYGAPNSVPSVVVDNLGLVDFYTVSGGIAGATNVAVQTSTPNGISLLFATNGNATPNTPCVARLNTRILLSRDL